MMEASKKLQQKYSEYGYIKVKKSGMVEFVLKKIKSPINKTKKNKTKKNKTKKVIKHRL